jgi:hypothetical protein
MHGYTLYPLHWKKWRKDPPIQAKKGQNKELVFDVAEKVIGRMSADLEAPVAIVVPKETRILAQGAREGDPLTGKIWLHKWISWPSKSIISTIDSTIKIHEYPEDPDHIRGIKEIDPDLDHKDQDNPNLVPDLGRDLVKQKLETVLAPETEEVVLEVRVIQDGIQKTSKPQGHGNSFYQKFPLSTFSVCKN